MIRIIVCRNAAAPTGCPLDDPNLIWGSDVSDSLLNTVQAAQERGRVEIDKNFSNRKNLQLNLVRTNYKEVGSLHSIIDPISLKTKPGIIRNFTLTITKRNREDLSIQRSIDLETLGD